jgi:hypothetical protein
MKREVRIERRTIPPRQKRQHLKKCRPQLPPALPIAAEIAKALKGSPIRFPKHWL